MATDVHFKYRQANPHGYRYSRFCELYQRRRSKLDVVLRQEHKAGEKISPIGRDRRFRYTAEASDQQIEAWLRTQVQAFDHFGGIRALAVPDNAKTG